MEVGGNSDLLPQAMKVIGALSGETEWSRPKHDMTEGFMMSADDMRPEETRLIGLS
jgi:hypothetical protein